MMYAFTCLLSGVYVVINGRRTSLQILHCHLCRRATLEIQGFNGNGRLDVVRSRVRELKLRCNIIWIVATTGLDEHPCGPGVWDSYFKETYSCIPDSGPSPGQSSDSARGRDFTSVRCRCRCSCGVVFAEPLCTQQSTDTFVQFTDNVSADVPSTDVGKLRRIHSFGGAAGGDDTFIATSRIEVLKREAVQVVNAQPDDRSACPRSKEALKKVWVQWKLDVSSIGIECSCRDG